MRSVTGVQNITESDVKGKGEATHDIERNVMKKRTCACVNNQEKLGVIKQWVDK